MGGLCVSLAACTTPTTDAAAPPADAAGSAASGATTPGTPATGTPATGAVATGAAASGAGATDEAATGRAVADGTVTEVDASDVVAVHGMELPPGARAVDVVRAPCPQDDTAATCRSVTLTYVLPGSVDAVWQGWTPEVRGTGWAEPGGSCTGGAATPDRACSWMSVRGSEAVYVLLHEGGAAAGDPPEAVPGTSVLMVVAQTAPEV